MGSLFLFIFNPCNGIVTAPGKGDFHMFRGIFFNRLTTFGRIALWR